MFGFYTCFSIWYFVSTMYQKVGYLLIYFIDVELGGTTLPRDGQERWYTVFSFTVNIYTLSMYYNKKTNVWQVREDRTQYSKVRWLE